MKLGGRLIHVNSQNLPIFFQNKGVNLYASIYGNSAITSKRGNKIVSIAKNTYTYYSFIPILFVYKAKYHYRVHKTETIERLCSLFAADVIRRPHQILQF